MTLLTQNQMYLKHIFIEAHMCNGINHTLCLCHCSNAQNHNIRCTHTFTVQGEHPDDKTISDFQLLTWIKDTP
jgi:hypothetical protein